MLKWVTGVMEAMGYGGIVFLMVLENVFPPIPSEVIMPLAGFTAARGELTFLGVVLAGTAGSVLGALPLYYLGRSVGERRVRAWAERYGKWLTISGEEIDRSRDWFDRHGGKAVFFCRLVPGIRSLISIPAGIAHMPMLPFLLYTTLGTGIWATALAYAGYLLGENYHRVEEYIGPVSYVAFAALAVAAIVWIVRRRMRTHR